MPAAAPSGVTCPNCGHVNPAGSNFCEECGTTLAGAASGAAPVPPPLPLPPMPPPTSLRLITSNGTPIPFPPNTSGAWLIGREDPVSGIHPEIDLTAHDLEQTVSRRHAQISLSGGQAMLTSLTSTNWTKLNGTRIAPNQPTPIKSGDKIEFAKCALTFAM
jgi:hypothetical protein